MNKYFFIAMMIFGCNLFAQTKVGIMVNSHITSIENYEQGKFQEHNKFYPFLNPTFLINFSFENQTISLRPGYFYTNSIQGVQLGSSYMRTFYYNFYALLGVNLIFPSSSVKGNSIVEKVNDRTFTFGVLGIGYSFKKLLIELSYNINFGDGVYGNVTYNEINGPLTTRDTKLNNIISLGFGVAL